MYKVILTFFILFLTFISSCPTQEVNKRDFPAYDQIQAVGASTSVWGQAVLWGSFAIADIGIVQSLASAYNWCYSNAEEARGPGGRQNCIDHIAMAAKRAAFAVALVVGGTNLAGLSAKREEVTEVIQSHLDQARHIYGFDLTLQVQPATYTTSTNGDNNLSYKLLDNDSVGGYIDVVNRNGTYGGYYKYNANPDKRAETCDEGEKCSSSETQYFGPYSIAVDMCCNADIDINDGDNGWLDAFASHLTGDWAAEYYKLYLGGGQQWALSWRVYDEPGIYWWTKCDTGS